MRLLFFGDLAKSGFGTVTTDAGVELIKLGVDVRFVSQNDTGDELPEPFRSRTVDLVSLPWLMNDMTGQAGTIGPADGIPALLNGSSVAKLHSGELYGRWRPDAAIILGDFMAVFHIVGRFLDAFKSVPTWHYCPVEGVDLPPLWKEMWDTVRPIAMTEFGADEIAKVVGYRPPMVYHGIDTTVFRPVSRASPMYTSRKKGEAVQTKDECKRAWLPQLAKANGVSRVPTQWLLRTDRHMPRKRYNSLIRCLVPVLERNTGWGLVLHCNALDQGGYLPATLSKVPESVRDRILFTDAVGVPREQLAILYNAADLYVSPSAEGFGLTIAEALACGVPAVGVHYSAVPEVIGPAGVTVPDYTLIDNEYDHFWAAVDEQAYARAVEHLMTHKTKRQDLGKLGPAHVARNFSWATAAQQFVSIIQPAISSGVAA